MFTGLVDDIGTILRRVDSAAGVELTVRSAYQNVVPGESIALNGVCLTVREHADDWFTVAAMTTTLERTTAGAWREGTRVNLERALRVGDRLGGHFVQGHVDGVGRVRDVARRESALLVDIDVGELAGLLVLHGSVAFDGVSLTVNALPGPTVVQVSLVEYTEHHTTLGALRTDDPVNVETDVIGKYVAKLLGSRL
jgi:riboflavin synthase